jgi:hypothetical protein
LRHG